MLTFLKQHRSLLHMAWSRRRRWPYLAFTLIGMLLCFAQFNEFRRIHDTDVKVTPTDYYALGLPTTIMKDQSTCSMLSISAEEIKNHRYRFQRALGGGKEGSTNIYLDSHSGEAVVVKRYKQGSEISWSEVPPSLLECEGNIPSQWPAEIPAALLVEEICGLGRAQDGFVPLRGFFFGSPEDKPDSPAWHLVMPLMAHGTIDHVAENLQSDQALQVQQLDLRFRSAFEGFLAILALLHAKNLCHDDIKPTNVLVHDKLDRWSLADYGQLRGADHPYHNTQLWIQSQQWQDCKLNDVRRALKLYLSFLRKACSDPHEFDAEFFNGEAPWSRIYWQFLESPMSAQGLTNLSQANPAAGSPHRTPGPSGQQPRLVPFRAFAKTTTVLKNAIDIELACRLLQGTQRYWYKIAFFGWNVEKLAARLPRPFLSSDI